jgi:inhibitor of cysteine peptidase
MMMIKILPVALVAILLLSMAVGGCVSNTFSVNNSSEIISLSIDAPVLSKFNSTDEIRSYLEQNTLSSGNYYYDAFDGAVPIRTDMPMPVPTPMPVPAPALASNAESATGKTAGLANYFISSPVYSTTNVQVAGVDEPDFVKNDGKYIYIISNNKLVIIDAYPAKGAKVVSETAFDGSATNLFVNGDRLIIFCVTYGYMPLPQVEDGAKKAIMPPNRYYQVTHALVYSISDRSHPRLEKDLSVDGSYFDARMIGDWVYMITKEQVSYYDSPIVVPAVYSGQEKLAQPDVYYFKNPEPSYVFHTVTTFNIKGGSGMQSKTFLMGQTNTMYVSTDNIYISYPLYNSVYVQPMILNPAGGTSLSQQEDAFNSLSEAEKQSYINGVPGIRDFVDTTKTVIHKIAIDNGRIDYVAKGEVGGTLLNQFSMDENGGMLRAATTSSVYTSYGGTKQYSNVYILDKEMELLGSLGHIAPDERIYSARFMGDRLYLVTYRNIDPLFVIDLSSGRQPKILGELKISGYSNFLYPYDATHIIGVGRETKDNSWGGVTNSGVKIAMFDVSDVNNPKLVDKYEIGNAQAYSEALSDHKAILLDPTKGIMVIPVSQWSNQPVIKPGYSYIAPQYWDGAYVFGLSRRGFNVKGTVTQDDSGSYGMDSVRRSLYIGNGLYTISSQKIVVSDLGNLNKIVEIILPAYVPVYNYATYVE